MNPSTEWTPEERLLIIGALARRMQQDIRDGGTPRGDLYDYAERIYMVAAMLPIFLEANRQTILIGV